MEMQAGLDASKFSFILSDEFLPLHLPSSPRSPQPFTSTAANLREASKWSRPGREGRATQPSQYFHRRRRRLRFGSISEFPLASRSGSWERTGSGLAGICSESIFDRSDGIGRELPVQITW